MCSKYFGLPLRPKFDDNNFCMRNISDCPCRQCTDDDMHNRTVQLCMGLPFVTAIPITTRGEFIAFLAAVCRLAKQFVELMIGEIAVFDVPEIFFSNEGLEQAIVQFPDLRFEYNKHSKTITVGLVPVCHFAKQSVETHATKYGLTIKSTEFTPVNDGTSTGKAIDDECIGLPYVTSEQPEKFECREFIKAVIDKAKILGNNGICSVAVQFQEQYAFLRELTEEMEIEHGEYGWTYMDDRSGDATIIIAGL